MGIDPAPFWANLFLCTYERAPVWLYFKWQSKSTKPFHATKAFIDNLGILNDRGLFNDVYKDMYRSELQLKTEHYSTHATFLNLGIIVKDGVFVKVLW